MASLCWNHRNYYFPNFSATCPFRVSCYRILLYGKGLVHLKILWCGVWVIHIYCARLRLDAFGSSSLLCLTRSNTPSSPTDHGITLRWRTLTNHYSQNLDNLKSYRNGDEILIEFELVILSFDRKIWLFVFVFHLYIVAEINFRNLLYKITECNLK